jgi:hypothetical protein
VRLGVVAVQADTDLLWQENYLVVDRLLNLR